MSGTERERSRVGVESVRNTVRECEIGENDVQNETKRIWPLTILL